MSLDQALAPFGGSSLSFVACEAVLRVAPEAPSVRPFTSVVAAAGEFGCEPQGGLEASRLESAERALWMMQSLDVGSDLFSVLSGLASAVGLYLAKHRQEGPAPGDLDAYDQRQAEDAVAKLLGISWVIHRLFQGTPQQRVQSFLGLQGARALLAWYVTVELALPFVDELGQGGSAWLDGLVERLRVPETARLA